MVGKMTYGKRQWEHLDAEMRRLIPLFHHEVNELVKAIDDDTAAFSDYMVRASSSDYMVRHSFRFLSSSITSPRVVRWDLDPSLIPSLPRSLGGSV